MNNEYIIVNKTAILKRIEELEKGNEAMWWKERDMLKQLLSQSAPLIPEIEEAFKAAKIPYKVNDYGTFGYENAEHYIEELKLDI